MNLGSAEVIPKIKHKVIKTAGRKRKLNVMSLERTEQEGTTVFRSWKSPQDSATDKCCTAFPGSKTMACWLQGEYGNPGDPTESHKEVSKLEQSITKRELIDAK